MNNSVSLPSPGIAPAIFRKTREERGLSQAQVAAALGVPRSSVTVLESDELRAKLARFYGIKSIDDQQMRAAFIRALLAVGDKAAADAECARNMSKGATLMRAAMWAHHSSAIAFNVVVGGFFASLLGAAGWIIYTGGAL